jgi:hypothetical protein
VSEETAELETLFDLFEKDLNVPATAIEIADGTLPLRPAAKLGLAYWR